MVSDVVFAAVASEREVGASPLLFQRIAPVTVELMLMLAVEQFRVRTPRITGRAVLELN